MKRFIPLIAAVTLTLGASFAQAQQNTVVVELFTSQGCSSCPPADAIMHELVKRDDVIALAFHVDYWDYIGWKDIFGDPAHAERQRAYAAHGGRRSIYTPEMVVQGQSDIVGAKPMKLSEAIAKHAREKPHVSLQVTRTDNSLSINAMLDDPAQKGPMRVYLLRYTAQQSVEIKRGENRGKTLQYSNIVEGLTEVASWDGATPLSLKTELSGEKPAVVIIQSQLAGPILAAAMVK